MKRWGFLINRTISSVQSKVRHLPFRKKVSKYPVNQKFFKTWSHNMSYVSGYIAADGNICHSGNAHTLHIASDDLDVIEKIKTVMNYAGPIHKKPRPNGKISYSLRICDQTIFADLTKLGITERKSLTLSPIVKRGFVADFLRGYLDGDGTVHVRKIKYPSKLTVIFYTASQPMARFIHLYLSNWLGNLYMGTIRARITKYGNPYYSTSLGHKASLKLYSILYANTDLYMNRKHQKFLEGMKK